MNEAAMKSALERWQRLFYQGYKRTGVGAGSVFIRKWDADEAIYWTEIALGQRELPAPAAGSEVGND